jgi:hypothetical protein
MSFKACGIVWGHPAVTKVWHAQTPLRYMRLSRQALILEESFHSPRLVRPSWVIARS